MSPRLTIPDWVPPVDTGKPPADALNRVAPPRRLSGAATNLPIRTVYGRDRVFGRILTVYQSPATGNLYVAYAFCRGPIDAFETIYVDGVDVTDVDEGFDIQPGTERSAHLGDQTTVDSILSAAFAADGKSYTDINPDIAFVVLKVPYGTTKGFPRVEAIIRGLKLYDPRKDGTNGGTGLHRLANSATWEWTANPALACTDFAYHTVGWGVNWPSVIDLADRCDELIAGKPRRALGLTLEEPSTAEDWIQAFRVYMGAFVVWERGVLRFIPERADVAVPYKAHFGAVSALTNRIESGAISPTLTIPDAAVTVIEIAFDWQGAAPPGATAVLLTTRGTLTTATQAGVSFGHSSATQGSIQFAIGEGTNQVILASDRDDLMDGGRHLVSVRIDRVNDLLEMAVDGVKQATTADISGLVGAIGHALGDILLGVDELNTLALMWDGGVDELRWWGANRTDAQIAADSDEEIDTLDRGDMLLYWTFNEGVGNTVNDKVGSIDGTMGANVTWDQNSQEIIAANVARHFTADDIVENTLRLSRRSLRDDPTVVQVEYVDASGEGWPVARQEAAAPGVGSGSVPRRVSRISLPGIHDASQAYREAVERVNWFISDLEATLTVYDEGFEIQQGSIVAVTHPIGLIKKLFRVRRAIGRSGYWTFDLSEYDPSIYSDAVISDPTFPDTNLLSPLAAPAVLNLSAVEELYRSKTGTYSSRVRVEWTAPNSPYVVDYRVEGYVAGELVMSGTTGQTSFVTPAVEELVSELAVEYEILVFARTSVASSPANATTVNILGKLAVPGNVPSVSATQISADAFQIKWQEAVDIDIFRYHVKIGTTADTWETATELERVDGLGTIVENLPVGIHRLFVKAIDSVRNESVVATTEDVTVVLPEPPTGLTGFEIGGEARLRWTASATPYVGRYRITYDLTGGGNEQTLDIADALRFSTRDVPEGDWVFRVYSVDNAGNESLTAASIQLTVTSDADTFVADEAIFSSPTVTNMHGWLLRLSGSDAYYVTNMAETFTDTDFSDHAATPLATYHSSGASEFLTETHDFGALVNGTFIATVPVTVLSGSVTSQLELSVDNISWDVVTALSTRGSYRYARVRVTTTGLSTAYIISQQVRVQVNVVPIEENGSILTLTSGGAKVVLSRRYGAVAELSLSVQSSVPVTTVYDNIILEDGANGNVTTFDVYAFDPFTQQIAATVVYKFKGV